MTEINEMTTNEMTKELFGSYMREIDSDEFLIPTFKALFGTKFQSILIGLILAEDRHDIEEAVCEATEQRFLIRG